MIQFTSISRNSDGSWSFVWDDQGADYYRIVLHGQTIATTEEPTYDFSYGVAYTEFPPPIEVVYEDEPALTEQYRPFAVLQWYQEEDCKSYRVQQYVEGAWRKVADVAEAGQWIYTYTSPPLEDDTIHQFRVMAVDDLGNLSTPRQYNVHIVRPPATPDQAVEVSYAGGSVVISES